MSLGMFMVRGNRMHAEHGGEWRTSLDGGTTWVEGFDPDPDYVEPKAYIDGHPAPDGYKRTLFKFRVMHCGWECDDEGWVVEMADGSRALLLTSHTSLYVAEASELEEKLAEYESVIADTHHALKTLRDSDTRPKDGDAKQGSTRE